VPDSDYPQQYDDRYLPAVPTERLPEHGGYDGSGYGGSGNRGVVNYDPAGPPPPHYDRPARLASEDVVVAAPMSFAGSAERLWKITRSAPANAFTSAAVHGGVLLLIAVAWAVVLCWYLFFGLWLVPYRLIRRGQRKRRREDLRHREMLTMMHQRGREIPPPPDYYRG
jgi:hypothetical protein